MKPTIQSNATAQGRPAARCCQIPAAPRHVDIDFLPQSDWTIEVDLPWPSSQFRRDHPAPMGRATQPGREFAPLELVIAAAREQRRQQRRVSLGVNF